MRPTNEGYDSFSNFANIVVKECEASRKLESLLTTSRKHNRIKYSQLWRPLKFRRSD